MINKQIKFKLVDTAGQITAVVFGNYTAKLLSPISTQIMSSNKKVEQVAFVCQKGSKYYLGMMGAELSINGTLAGSYLIKSKSVVVRALNQAVSNNKSKDSIEIKFPKDIVESKNKNVVLLKGIGYIISNRIIITKKTLDLFCQRYSLPAFGVVRFKQNKIYPTIYVKDTNSLVTERACGSGSLSFALYSGYSKIIQPSNKIISISEEDDYFTIKVPVKIVK